MAHDTDSNFRACPRYAIIHTELGSDSLITFELASTRQLSSQQRFTAQGSLSRPEHPTVSRAHDTCGRDAVLDTSNASLSMLGYMFAWQTWVTACGGMPSALTP
jgi:hypothetical protein